MDWRSRTRELISHSGMSDRAFSDKINLAQGQLSNILSGKRNPKMETRARIAEYFGVSLHWLDTGEEEHNPYLLPLLTFETLDNYLSNDIFDTKDFCLDFNHIKNSFLFRFDNFLSEPKHSLNNNLKTILQVDRSLPIRSTDIVLLSLPKGGYYAFKWTQIGKNNHIFKATNRNFKSFDFEYIEESIEDIFVGKIIAYKVIP